MVMYTEHAGFRSISVSSKMKRLTLAWMDSWMVKICAMLWDQVHRSGHSQLFKGGALDFGLNFAQRLGNQSNGLDKTISELLRTQGS
eukprot:scaffold194797_cov18-Tisochrysis_lutea.AAC.1